MDESDIFMGAVEKRTPDERSAFLDEACGNDLELRGRIENLLKAHSDSGSFLDHPALNEAALPRDRPNLDFSHDPAPIDLGFLASVEDDDAIGKLGAYIVTEFVGRGGMGIVLKAHDPKLNRVVALKVLAPELAGNATARRRFVREAQAAAAISDPHVVTIYAVEEGRLPFMVMEFVGGQSLQEKIDIQGPLDLKETLRIGTQIATGLEAAHAQGVIHRDIKPANVLLENGVERARITDFGLARAIDDAGATRTGVVAGTPQYMSPEQARGETCDARSDLFNLGCVLYAMCSGRSPFRADSTIAVIRRVCDEKPKPLRQINVETPEWLVDIIDRLLSKVASNRIQTASEVANLLGRHLAHIQDPDSSPAPSEPERHMWLLRFAITTVLLVGAGFAITESIGLSNLLGLKTVSQNNQAVSDSTVTEGRMEVGDEAIPVDQEIAELSRRIDEEDLDGAFLIKRAYLYIRQCRWRDADNDFGHAGDAVLDKPENGFAHAIILAYLQDVDRHRQLCEKMVAHFGATEDVWTANCLVKACLLRPNLVDLDALPMALLAEDRQFVTQEPSWVLSEGRALFALRSRDFEEAKRQIRGTMNEASYKEGSLYAPRGLLILAMAHEASGDRTLATELFVNAAKKVDMIQLSTDDIRAISWLYAEVLRREAAERIGTEDTGFTTPGDA